MANTILQLFKKEMLEMVRDKRALTTFLFMVLGFPLLYIVIMGVTINKAKEDSQKDLKAQVYGLAEDHDLSQFLKTQDVELVFGDEFSEEDFVKTTDELAIVAPKTLDLSKVGDPESRKIILYVNQKEKAADRSARRLGKLLSGYSQSIATRRLMLRGVNPQIMAPISIQKIDLDGKDSLTAAFLQLLASVLCIACFMSTIYLSVDTIAGEKQRNSLEPLLVTPCPRYVYIIPKFLMIFTLIIVALIASTVFYTQVVKTPFLQNLFGVSLDLSPTLAVSAIALFLPLGFLGAAVQVYLSTMAKSVKEAQGYASVVGLTGMMPAMLAGQLLDKTTGVIAYIPSVSQSLLMEKLISKRTSHVRRDEKQWNCCCTGYCDVDFDSEAL